VKILKIKEIKNCSYLLVQEEVVSLVNISNVSKIHNQEDLDSYKKKVKAKMEKNLKSLI
jgi:hypothetical protein